MEDIDALNLDLDLTIVGSAHVDIGFAEDDEEVSLAGVLEVCRHVQIGIHACLQYRHASELGEVGRVRFVVECAGDQDVEIDICGFSGGFHKVGARDGSEFGADVDAGASSGPVLVIAFDVLTDGAD